MRCDLTKVMKFFDKNTVDLVEIFHSIDGEGKRAGELVTFIRLAGCNLRCSYCDTMYAHNEESGTPSVISEIALLAKAYGDNKVTLTGGEPLIHRNVYTLLNTLVKMGIEVNIETNGSVNVLEAKSIFEGTSSFITMDVKSPSSGMSDRNNLYNLSLLDEKDVVKFVVGTQEDLKYMYDVMKPFEFNPRFQWYISPVFEQIEPAEIVEYMKKERLHNAKIQLQMHKFIWDPNKKGV